MALLDRINDLNRDIVGRDYYRYIVNGEAVGFVDTQLLDEIATSPVLFSVSHESRQVTSDFESESREIFESEMEAFFRDYFTRKQVTGWRDEQFAVSKSYASETLFLIERVALAFLGITGHGVHVNGYVEKPDGLYIWVAKRSLNKTVSPGKLDQISAGGLPHGLSPLENVIKECEEEASIPRHLAETARPVSAISYHYDLPIGMRPDVMFNYDLRLPEDFVPQINDDEVDSFALRHIDDALEQVATSRDFKFNSAAAIIDFAIRHSIITPEHPDYLSLSAGLHWCPKKSK